MFHITCKLIRDPRGGGGGYGGVMKRGMSCLDHQKCIAVLKNNFRKYKLLQPSLLNINRIYFIIESGYIWICKKGIIKIMKNEIKIRKEFRMVSMYNNTKKTIHFFAIILKATMQTFYIEHNSTRWSFPRMFIFLRLHSF